MTLTAADLGGDWRTYSGPVHGEGQDSNGCQTEADSLFKSAIAGTNSDIHQRGEQIYFVRSTAIEFPDDATATRYANAFLADEYIECARKGTEAILESSNPGVVIAPYGIERHTDDDAYRGQFWLIGSVDGSTTMSVLYRVYRKGSVTTVAYWDLGDPGATHESLEQVGTEIAEGMDKALARG